MLLPHLRHLFTPQTSNNHRPRIIHPAGLSVLIGLFIFFNSSLRLLAQVDQDIVRGGILGYASDISVEQVIQLTNQERAHQGLAPLTENSLLSSAAQAKAADMFQLDYWSHNSPTGKQPWNFIRQAGYKYRYAGENLARDFGDTPAMVAAWMASPTHRDNILSPRYQEIGIAVVDGELEGIATTLVVQMFGTLASQQAVSSTSTSSDSETVAQESQTPASLAQLQSGQALSQTSLLPAQTHQTATPRITPISLSKAVSLSILILLSLVLISDQLISRKKKLIRLTGKNLAHLGFITLVIVLVLLSQAGGII
jgi:hypothetical protein